MHIQSHICSQIQYHHLGLCVTIIQSGTYHETIAMEQKYIHHRFTFASLWFTSQSFIGRMTWISCYLTFWYVTESHSDIDFLSPYISYTVISLLLFVVMWCSLVVQVLPEFFWVLLLDGIQDILTLTHSLLKLENASLSYYYEWGSASIALSSTHC